MSIRLFSKTSRPAMVLGGAILALGMPLYAQEAPADDHWDSMAQGNDGLPSPRAKRPEFDAFAPTAMDSPNIATIDPNTITTARLTAGIVEEAASLSREHTFPGGVAALRGLGRAFHGFAESPQARAETLLRVGELHLRVIGDHGRAGMIETATTTLASQGSQTALAFIRGIAQDMHKIGALTAARHLEQAARAIETQGGDRIVGVLDAVTLALRYGAHPQPSLAEILGSDALAMTEREAAALVSDLLDRIGATIGDARYAELAASVDRAATPAELARLRAQAEAARNRVQSSAETRRGGAAPASNGRDAILGRR